MLTDNHIYLGYEVSLGILSAWEPCGGILCANLPVVYRVLVHGFEQIKSAAARSSRSRSVAVGSGDAGDNNRRPDSQSPLYPDWTRLNHSGASDTTSQVSPKISAGGRPAEEASELDTFGNSIIMVERTFKQDFGRRK